MHPALGANEKGQGRGMECSPTLEKAWVPSGSPYLSLSTSSIWVPMVSDRVLKDCLREHSTNQP